MICPYCGVDTDAYLRGEAERQALRQERAKKGKEFERICGEQVRQIRRKRTVAGVVIGTLFGILVMAVYWYLAGATVPGRDHYSLSMAWSSFWSSNFYIGVASVVLYSLFFGLSGYIIAKKPGKQEKELRKNFGL